MNRSELIERTDRKLIKIIKIILAVSAVGVLSTLVLSADLFSTFSFAIAMLNILAIIIGIMVWVSRGDLGIIPNKHIFKLAGVLTLLGGAIATAYFYSVEEAISIGLSPGLSVDISPHQDIISTLATFGGISLGVWGMILGYTSIGFGVVWITTSLTRKLIPAMLKMVRQYTSNSSDSILVKITAWFIAVPDVLDASMLRTGPTVERKSFPVRTFFRAVGWELLIGTIIAVYISLNPFIIESLSLSEALSILGALSLIIPLIVLPWFALIAINARIPGMKKDFFIFNGIRSRILQTFVALGTIAIFVRLALKEYEIKELLPSFISYYITLSLLAILFTFIYFNFFESDLANSINE